MNPTEPTRFRDREDAARHLATLLKGRDLRDPVVLAIPRGGVVTGAILARELGADLDVVLSRKLRAPMQPELAVGAVGEDGHVVFNPAIRDYMNVPDEYLEDEKRHQLAEIARRKKLVRGVRPAVPLAGRSVIVADDGIATGSTMIAALQTARAQHPHELIAAAPVGSPDRIAEIRRWCDEVVCLLTPGDFWAIGQFYDYFYPVEDDEMLQILREFVPAAAGAETGT
jgi:predicted phosphoribosyltransferase